MLDKLRQKMTENKENGSRKAVLEDLFYDFNRSRGQIYKMNFVRGLTFGVGSVLGGTVVIALLVYVLSLLVGIPGIGDFFQNIVNTVNDR